MKLSLNTKILLGAVLGVCSGFLLSLLGVDSILGSNILYVSRLAGGLFIALLKMILIPLVFVSITVGIANLRQHAQMQKVWKTSLCYYIGTTALSVFLGLCVVNIFKPGVGLELSLFKDSMGDMSLQSLTVKDFLENFLKNLFVNPIESMAQGQILPTIIFAVFLGIALVKAKDKTADTILNIFNEGFNLIMMMVGWIMQILPFGIFFLLTELVATQDLSLFQALLKFILVVLGATLFHGFIVLPTLLIVLGKKSPGEYFSSIQEALITAFSTSSSSATLPITYRCVTGNLKVDKDIAGFVLPLGATINMDGTALYEAVAAIFIANLVGIDLNIIQQIIVFLMAILASIGAPGIPSAGMVTMVMVLQSVGLPAEAIAILMPIDRLLDAVRTMVNVNGDAIGSVIVGKFVSK